MNGFSLTDAALEGLRITRERPTAVLWWWAVWIVAALAQSSILSLPAFRLTPELVTQFQTAGASWAANQGDAAASQRMMDLTAKVARPVGALIALELLAQLVVSTAVMRAVLRPAEHRFGAVRLSPDELRQLGLAAMTLAAATAYGLVVVVLASAALTALGANPAAMIVANRVIVILALAWPAVRVSLAPPMTLADRRVSFARAWPLTKGRFTVLLGAYAIALVIAMALNLAVQQFVLTALQLAGAPSTATSFIPDLKQLGSPYVLVDVAVATLLSALTSAILSAPVASAFRQITGRVGAPSPAMTVNESSPWG